MWISFLKTFGLPDNKNTLVLSQEASTGNPSITRQSMESRDKAVQIKKNKNDLTGDNLVHSVPVAIR